MARGFFDPKSLGLRKVRYQRGDVRNRSDVAALLAGADSVVHLAFAMHGRRRISDAVNLDGSRNVFEEAVRSGATTLCYASSIGAYGAPNGHTPLDESAPPRGVAGDHYSEQKAAVERLLEETLAGTAVRWYSLRLSIVAGPSAQLMLREIPYVRLRDAISPRLRKRLARWLRPLLPDTGVALQVVHEDDAAAAFVAAALGRGSPGPYNIAAAGTVTVSDLARQLGWRSFRLPRATVELAARAARLLPPIAALAWLEIARTPILVSTERAHRQLGWSPRFTASETIAALVDSYRERGKAG